MKKSRTALIHAWEDLLCSYEEYDVWACDIAPKLPKMSTEEIRRQYEQDIDWYEYRASMMQA